MVSKRTMKAAWIGVIATITAAAAGLATTSISQAAEATKNITQPTNNAIAQAVNPNPPRYLSVTGDGRAYASADKGALIFAFRKSSSYLYSDDVPEDYDIDAPVDADDLSAITQMLISAGISESDISLSKDQFGSFGEIDLMVEIEAPTRDRVNALVDRVVATDEAEKIVELSSVQAYYSARNCEATEIEARRLAIADAQEQATELAAISNITIGEISSISSHGDWGYFSGPLSACPDNLEDVLRYGSEYSQMYNRLDTPGVSFDISISVSYFIE